MKFLRGLFGLDFPDPVVGQVWISRHSQRCMRVCEVQVTDCGTVMVSVQKQHHDSRLGWGIGDHYACGLSSWRRKLRAERRELLCQLDQAVTRRQYAAPPRSP